MPLFKKKPVVINAWPARDLILAAAHKWDYLPEQVRRAYEMGGWVFQHDAISIPTLEGAMLAQIDDMVIEGVSGEFYPCKPDIFTKTYEAVEPAPLAAPMGTYSVTLATGGQAQQVWVNNPTTGGGYWTTVIQTPAQINAHNAALAETDNQRIG